MVRARIFAALLAVLLLSSGARATNTGGYDNGITFTPTVTAGAYASGQSMGGLQTVKVFRTTTVTSWIFDIFQITSKGGNTGAMTIYTYDTKPVGTCTDTSAFVENATDIGKRFMAPFVMTPAVVGAGTTSSTAQLLQVVSGQNHDSPQTQNLYICIVANGVITPGSTSDLVVKIGGAQD
jgi:hypothetical protein